MLNLEEEQKEEEHKGDKLREVEESNGEDSPAPELLQTENALRAQQNSQVRPKIVAFPAQRALFHFIPFSFTLPPCTGRVPSEPRGNRLSPLETDFNLVPKNSGHLS